MATTQDHQSIDTVTSDKTPTVVPTFTIKAYEAPGSDVCDCCGDEVSIFETAWIWRGRIYCDKPRCKPVKR